MDEHWPLRRLDELGPHDRPALKAGPFGSSLTKDRYIASGYKVYGQQEVVSGDVSAESYYVPEEIFRKHKSCAVKPGDILITMMGTVGQLFEVPPGAEAGVINPRLMRISLDRDTMHPAFVKTYLESVEVQRLIDRRSQGGTMPGLNAQALGSIEVPTPPLHEQRKIAEILRTWDQAIENLSALRAAKQRTYASLLDELIFGRRRLGGRNHDWHARRLGEVSSELTRRNASGGLGREVVMGVTKANGIVPMREQTIGGDLTRYKILPPRAFAYNPMRINVGSIAMSHLLGEALISPDYVLFECDDGRLSADYLDHLRRTHFWSHHINAGGSGSVRMRTYYDDLAAIRLPLPDFEEQQAIASVLDAACAEVRLIGKEIDALVRQKRGLMQKLLTGEWRVAVENAP